MSGIALFGRALDNIRDGLVLFSHLQVFKVLRLVLARIVEDRSLNGTFWALRDFWNHIFNFLGWLNHLVAILYLLGVLLLLDDGDSSLSLVKLDM